MSVYILRGSYLHYVNPTHIEKIEEGDDKGVLYSRETTWVFGVHMQDVNNTISKGFCIIFDPSLIRNAMHPFFLEIWKLAFQNS